EARPDPVAARSPGGLARPAGLDPADDGAAELGVRDAEALQHLPGLALLIARKREQHVLRADVRRAELARLLVGGEQGGLRVGSERRRQVRPLALLRLLLELCGDRVRVGVD